ncbi:hypothetical protein [Frankia sp. Cr2]|uniref:hypothetical protein n=1 Tax=Frankia sp. Cr2 TaxID=3073932 RepID=UPI002AD2B7B7|nr:hypothetical protein [Frankia sp. Cr2]
MTHRMGRGVVMLAISAATAFFVGFTPASAFAGDDSWDSDSHHSWTTEQPDSPTASPTATASTAATAAATATASPTATASAAATATASAAATATASPTSAPTTAAGVAPSYGAPHDNKWEGAKDDKSWSDAKKDEKSYSAPSGGVNAGGGGTAPSFPITPVAGVGLGAAMLGAGLTARRRSRATQ